MIGARCIACVIASGFAILSSACREALGPWSPSPEAADSSSSFHLTHSSGTEVYPAWTPDGAEILYAASAYPGSPPGKGLLLAVPPGGGVARLLFPDLQGATASGPRWLAGPVPSPDGSSIAYFDLVSVAQPGTVVSALPCFIPEPVLDSAVLRVRRRGATGSILDDPRAAVPFAGRDPGQRLGAPDPYTTRTFPFQARFSETGVLSARPSWAPDGSRLVYSDGLRLWIWTADESPPAQIPGSEDGTSPAWSPDGEWIVFTRLERGDSITQTCDVDVGRTVVRHYRRGYAEARGMLVRIRSDGSDAVDLGTGMDPAWTPDAGSIYFRDASRIFRMRADGNGREEISGTQGGEWPAVSPDGNRLAFMRRATESVFDLWIVPVLR